MLHFSVLPIPKIRIFYSFKEYQKSNRLYVRIIMKFKKVLSLVFLMNACLLSQAQLNIPQMKHKVLLSDEGNQKVHYIDMSDGSKNWSISLGNRDMQLIGNNRLMLSNSSGFEEYDLTTQKQLKKITIGSQIQSVFRINAKETFIGVDGNVPHLEIIDSATGQSHKTINIEPPITLRIIRPTSNGTFLVGGRDAGMVYEFDSTGKKVWEANVGGSPYQAVRLKNGNTVISTGYGAQIAIVDKDANIIRKFPQNPKDASLASLNPNFFGGFQILNNGNIVVANWQGHGAGHGTSGSQLLEFDSTGILVSYWKQDANIVSSLHGVIVMDNLDPSVINSDINGVLEPVDQVNSITKRNHSNLSVISNTNILTNKEFTLSGKLISSCKAKNRNTAQLVIIRNDAGIKKLTQTIK